MSLTMTLDPQGMYTHARTIDLFKAAGYIPHFILNGIDKHQDIKGCIEIEYQFFPGWSEMNWKLTDDNCLYVDGLEYEEGEPEEEPFKPFVSFDFGGETLYMYPHAMIAIKYEQSDDLFVVRAD